MRKPALTVARKEVVVVVVARAVVAVAGAVAAVVAVVGEEEVEVGEVLLDARAEGGDANTILPNWPGGLEDTKKLLSYSP